MTAQARPARSQKCIFEAIGALRNESLIGGMLVLCFLA